MIYSITINNLALISQAQIEFSKGLNVLSGETGAGKSIVVDSMNLILGGRADRELIKSGEEKARVEAIIYPNKNNIEDLCETYGIEAEDELIVSRELSADGKNICRINGRAVSLNILREFTSRLIDIHSQHEYQQLLKQTIQLEMVDNYGKAEIASIKEKISQEYSRLKASKKKLSEFGNDKQDIARKIDILKYEISEIESAKLSVGEEENLREELKEAENAEKIVKVLGECGNIISGGAIDSLGRIKRDIENLSDISEKYADFAEKFAEAYYNLEDLGYVCTDLANDVYVDESKIKSIEDRLELIYDLKRKFGDSEQAVLDYYDEAVLQLSMLEKSDDIIAQLEEDIKQSKRKLEKQYTLLSQARKQSAQKLESEIVNQLKDLGMKNCEFTVVFEKDENITYGLNGWDKAEYYISANKGQPLKPLAKVASGGEISRIMLAFKTVFSDADKTSTLIFDEIDTGISGNMAHTVAEKMAMIAQSKQVICVTHLPQIAAMADSNYVIEKTSDSKATYTNITKISDEEKILEISRLSGGDGSKESLGHAKNMLAKAIEFKKSL